MTSLGGSPLKVDEWKIDAIYSGSQKCLSCPPGLSPISFSERVVDMVKNRKGKVQSWFMDLNLLLGYWGTTRTYHHTAPTNALYGLHEALVMLYEEGLEHSWARHQRNHIALKAGLETLGMQYLVEEKARLPQLNSVLVPEGTDERRYVADCWLTTASKSVPDWGTWLENLALRADGLFQQNRKRHALPGCAGNGVVRYGQKSRIWNSGGCGALRLCR